MRCLAADAGDALGNVLVWDILEGIVQHRLSGGGEPVDAVCWLGDKTVAASGVAGSVYLWDLAEAPAADGIAHLPTGLLPGNAGAPNCHAASQYAHLFGMQLTLAMHMLLMPRVKQRVPFADHDSAGVGRMSGLTRGQHKSVLSSLRGRQQRRVHLRHGEPACNGRHSRLPPHHGCCRLAQLGCVAA